MIYWILNIVVLAALVMLLYRTIKSDQDKLLFKTSLFLRIAGGLSAGYILFVLYPVSDSSVYFETAIKLLDEHSLWTIVNCDFDTEQFSRQPRVYFFIKFLSVFLVISGGSIWITAVLFSFISFYVSWYFFRSILQIYPSLRKLLAFCFLFIPSVIFWSSAILKDAPAFWSFLIVVALTLKVRQQVKITPYEFLFAIASIVMLFMIRHYLLITLLLFMGLTFGYHFIKRTNNKLRWPIAIGVLAAFTISSQFIHPYLNISRLPLTLYENNQIIVEKTRNENQLGIVLEDPSWSAVLREIPESIYAGLFRPTFFDKSPLEGYIHKIENLLLLTLVMLSGILIIRNKPSIKWDQILPAVFCILMMATFLALSTPNLGTLVRYKNAIVPFMFLISGILPFQYITSSRKG